jgi:CBS domain-containing membrane protein
MMAAMAETALDFPAGLDLTEADILAAMKKIPGYLDITPRDFKEIYLLAYRHALTRLSRELTAAEIMTREVVTVTADTPLAEVAAAMGARGISGVPVVDHNGRVTGIISEKDFLSRLGVTGEQNMMSLVAAGLKSSGCVTLPIKELLAKDIMTAPAITVTADAPIKEVAGLFTSRQVNRLPVVDAHGKVLGLVSRGDLLHADCGGGRL